MELESSGGSGDFCPASFAAWWARASAVQVRPVIAAAAPMTALRMKNERRSIPGGTSDSLGNSWNGPSSLGEVGVLMSCSGLVLGDNGLWAHALCTAAQSN